MKIYLENAIKKLREEGYPEKCNITVYFSSCRYYYGSYDEEPLVMQAVAGNHWAENWLAAIARGLDECIEVKAVVKHDENNVDIYIDARHDEVRSILLSRQANGDAVIKAIRT